MHNKNQRVSFVHVSISACARISEGARLERRQVAHRGSMALRWPDGFYGYLSSKQDLPIALVGDFHQGHFGFRLLALT